MNHQLLLTRRHLFGRGATGLGIAALASLVEADAHGASAFPSPPSGKSPHSQGGLPHFAPKAKRVIYLLQNGAPTHLDLFDYKPQLRARMGQEIPESVTGGQRLTTMTAGQKSKPVLPNITEFKQHGQSGAWVSNFLPHIASIADECCFIKSMHTEAINHAPAITLFLSGAELPGRPSMGAWLSYGLGSETQDLPAFVVMTSRDKEASCGQIFYDYYWGSGFLPSKFQGVKFRGSGDPVLYLSNPSGLSAEVRRGQLDDLAKLNQLKLREFGDPEIATRIAQYEMAYRMQTSVPELTDLRSEPAHILESYGPDVRTPGTFAYNCLLARRLVERGVRFVQLMHAGWDQHRNLTYQLETQCKDTDQPSAALVKDLKQRGMLDDTLVIWGGEFGRTPFLQGDINDRRNWGRDHHPRCFTIWMAGGGSSRACRTAKPTTTPTTSPGIRCTCTTSRPRCSICSASTIPGSPSNSRGATTDSPTCTGKWCRRCWGKRQRRQRRSTWQARDQRGEITGYHRLPRALPLDSRAGTFFSLVP